ncbi:MAG TPA: Holliday junction branch migration protein RuvA, partial [Anaerovoracaceae bacterium]|nr:Holliday junction branch migration protein RuvA [Anaerovoracaceae bacterium]
MIHYLKGPITMVFDGGIVVESGGVGYRVYVPDSSSLYAKKGETATVYTVMIVREDDMSLYGFSDNESLELFQQLRTVNGVGAKVAMSALSSIPAEQIKKAIVSDDAATLTKANGIGKKIAQRIVLELKDKIKATEDMEELKEYTTGADERAEAINALMGLGFSRSEAISAVGTIDNDDLTTEEYIR